MPDPWASLRVPLKYTRRNPAQQADDARRALHALQQQGPPPGLSEATYHRHLDVLQARTSNPEASLAELAATMSPPMTKEAIAGQLRRALAAAGVTMTRTEFKRIRSSNDEHDAIDVRGCRPTFANPLSRRRPDNRLTQTDNSASTAAPATWPTAGAVRVPPSTTAMAVTRSATTPPPNCFTRGLTTRPLSP